MFTPAIVGGQSEIDAAVAVEAAARAAGDVAAKASPRIAIGIGLALAGPVTAATAAVGDVVVSVLNVTTGEDVSASFEATISVNGQIQQTGTLLLNVGCLALLRRG